MTRQRMHAALTILIVVSVGCFLLTGRYRADPPPTKPAHIDESKSIAAGSAKRLSTAEAIAVLLAPTDKLNDDIDAKTPLEEALATIGKLHGLQFKIDDESFKQQGEGEIAKKPTHLAGKKGVPLAELLQETLDHATELRSTFYVRDGKIMIATIEWAFLATGCDMAQILNPDAVVRFLHCQQRPLNEMLVELGERHGRSVVFDPRLGDKAKTPVSVTLQFATVNSVVRLLANMADLQAVPLDNILYVTSRENAKRLQSELAEPLKPTVP